MCNSDRIMNANMTDSDIKTEDVVQEEQIETTQILAPLEIEELRLEEQTPEKIVEIIQCLQQNTLRNTISIGICLKVIKERIEKENQSRKRKDKITWTKWVEEKVKYSRQTTYKFIECADRFKEVALARQLNTGQMFELLKIPKEYFREFMATIDTATLQAMTKQEVRELINSWLYKKNLRTPTPTRQYLITSKVVKPKEFKTVGIHIKRDDIEKFAIFLTKSLEADDTISKESKEKILEVANSWLEDKKV